jgi:hypothetical protein
LGSFNTYNVEYNTHVAQLSCDEPLCQSSPFMKRNASLDDQMSKKEK